MKENRVSIILPYYNGREFIKEALDSILSQTYKDFELLLVDDGSPDQQQSADAKDLIDSYRDERFKYLYKENGGLSSARNYGYAHSTGDCIAFIDQDDLWRPEKLELQMKVLRSEPRVEFIFTSGEFFGNVSKPYPRPRGLSEGFVSDSYSKMLRGNFVSSITVLFKKTLAERVGLSNRNYAVCPDYEYFIRMSEKTDFYFLDKSLVRYRMHEKNTSKQIARAHAEVLCILTERKKVTLTQKSCATYQFLRTLLFLSIGWAKDLFCQSA